MKMQRISQFQTVLPLNIFQQNYTAYQSAFLASDLGKIWTAVPWQDLVDGFGLKDACKGLKVCFHQREKIALIFLKHYAGCSDNKFIGQLNGNIDYQFFCDIFIPPNRRIENYKIVSEIRCQLAKNMDIDGLQKVLATHWWGYCADKNSMVMDTTCYESYLRYPTDVKLLWEAVNWSYVQLKRLCRQQGTYIIRSKLGKWRKRYSSCSKQKSPRKKTRKSLTRGLLGLLKKIDAATDRLEQMGAFNFPVPKYMERRATIKQVLQQQQDKFYKDINPKDRIVSIDKPYLRPIVRGKEIKKVEFGAKLHKFQIDGISFIDVLSFDAFNEGLCLRQSVKKAAALMASRIKFLGANGIYANNNNRVYDTENNIKTDFKRKGKPGKYKTEFAVLRKAITNKELLLWKVALVPTKNTFCRIELKPELRRPSDYGYFSVFILQMHSKSAEEWPWKRPKQLKTFQNINPKLTIMG